MADPFYADLGEIKHNLSNLATSLQRLLESTPVRQNGTATDRNGGPGGGAFDKDVVQDIVKLIGKLETQLKDLSDTFAIQTTNAKKLGLSPSEMTSRKEIVESNHKSFESMRENFVYLIKDDPAVHRSSKERNHTIAGKENKKAFEPLPPVPGSPPLSAVGRSAFDVESDSDDDLEIRHYQKEPPFATSQMDAELGPLRLTMDNHREGMVGRMRNWIAQSRRNKMIFAGSNIVVFVVLGILLILAIF
ncbi:hypothetical protein BV898_04436 [Hypsibius exemplaris]|uniref:Syntaxin 6/10/61 N-terminal domain-containing protein n=1 Tax=Hypsibius exemplaris TaxID=2072580 RepID=A0A1W0X274_HYPEX|nr:hypothetical protein BV898_04436 [Hypsibius exemplaris]